MKKILLPLILLLLGTGSGVGAGLMLRGQTHAEEETALTCPPTDNAHSDTETEAAELPPGGAEDQPGKDYARLNNQFVVPVVADGKVEAMVVLSLSIEVVLGQKDAIFAAEPKLRDVFLQVLFDHANMGGFGGNFTSGENMRALREGLRRAAQSAIGPQITDVLIIDIVRQDV